MEEVEVGLDEGVERLSRMHPGWRLPDIGLKTSEFKFV